MAASLLRGLLRLQPGQDVERQREDLQRQEDDDQVHGRAHHHHARGRPSSSSA